MYRAVGLKVDGSLYEGYMRITVRSGIKGYVGDGSLIFPCFFLLEGSGLRV